MKIKNITILLFAVLALQSCKKYDANGKEIKFHELYKANWLLGEWEKKDSVGILKEVWIAKDDSTYTAKSIYIINKNDTVHQETIELMQNGEFLIYTATVEGENHNQPVSFAMIEDKDSLLVFENKKHDYPQKIRYQLSIDNSFLATVSGKQNGKESSESYLMKKVVE